MKIFSFHLWFFKFWALHRDMKSWRQAVSVVDKSYFFRDEISHPSGEILLICLFFHFCTYYYFQFCLLLIMLMHFSPYWRKYMCFLRLKFHREHAFLPYFQRADLSLLILVSKLCRQHFFPVRILSQFNEKEWHFIIWHHQFEFCQYELIREWVPI